jgi:uncharacterized protein (DUF952 family)
VICHLVGRSEWAAGADGYRPASLASEGFIHFSAPEQAVATANRYYAGRADLLLVVVNPERLSAELRWEPPAPVTPAGQAPAGGTPAPGELFPHLYGTIDTAAVTIVVPFPPDPDGVFRVLPSLW